MIGYAAAMGKGRNRDALKAAGWGLFLIPDDPRPVDGFRYAVDCGSWVRRVKFDKGEASSPVVDLDRYHSFACRFAPGADFLVVPDIVLGGAESLALTRAWIPRLGLIGCPLLVAVQDGMEPSDIADLVGPRVGIGVGGSTDWKLATMKQWVDFARSRGARSHVFRVNTARRIYLCDRAGAHGFDGSSVSRYGDTLRLLEGARKVQDIEGFIARAGP